MRESDVEKVTRALQEAQERGDDEFVAAVRRDINVLMLPFERIIKKHKL